MRIKQGKWSPRATHLPDGANASADRCFAATKQEQADVDRLVHEMGRRRREAKKRWAMMQDAAAELAGVLGGMSASIDGLQGDALAVGLAPGEWEEPSDASDAAAGFHTRVWRVSKALTSIPELPTVPGVGDIPLRSRWWFVFTEAKQGELELDEVTS